MLILGRLPSPDHEHEFRMEPSVRSRQPIEYPRSSSLKSGSFAIWLRASRSENTFLYHFPEFHLSHLLFSIDDPSEIDVDLTATSTRNMGGSLLDFITFRFRENCDGFTPCEGGEEWGEVSEHFLVFAGFREDLDWNNGINLMKKR